VKAWVVIKYHEKSSAWLIRAYRRPVTIGMVAALGHGFHEVNNIKAHSSDTMWLLAEENARVILGRRPLRSELRLFSA